MPAAPTRRRGRLVRAAVPRLLGRLLALLLVALGGVVVTGSPAQAAACASGRSISNGTILLGVNCLGDLGVGDDGLRYQATGNDAVSQGCTCEGWGVADTVTGVSGYANESSGDSSNLSLVSFTSDPSSATSVVNIGSTFKVTQDFHPSEQTPNLYEVTVSVTNTSDRATQLRYRRVMDWDILPSPFYEYVSLNQGNSPRVRFSSDDGFASPDPLAGPSSILASGSFENSGPTDHGALFDFDFGTLAAGDAKTFEIYYGAADSEALAKSALNAVNAEAYSLGKPSTDGGLELGTPNTFVFGFKDIDGSSVFAPRATNDDKVAYTGVPKTLGVLANDYDPNGDRLTITGNTSPSNGTVRCSDTDCVYTSADGYLGPDRFYYTISDGNGGLAQASVDLSVTEVPRNRPPVAADDTLALDEDATASVDVRANDSDADGDNLAVTGWTQPAHGSASCTDAGCSYVPAANWNGTDSFDYTVDDGNGGTDTGTVVVTVRPVNDAPVARDDTAATDEDTAVDVAVTGNDSDAEGSQLAAVLTRAPAHGTVSCAGGGCSYVPDADWNGTDTFGYSSSDGALVSDPATVTITVRPVNDPPIAVDDAAGTGPGQAVQVDVLANDSDADGDRLTVSTHDAPADGSVTCTASACTYTPADGFAGSDSFSYTVADGNGGTASATVHLTVSRVNRPPVAVADSVTTSEDAAVTFDVIGNDTDADGDQLQVTEVSDPASGSVTCTAAGSCRYLPDADFNGPDSFSYTLSDGAATATGTVAVTVTPVNDDPVARADSLTTDEDTQGTVSVLGNDTDVDGDALSLTATTGPGHGSVACTAAGVCGYRPAANYNGTDSFGYTITDGHGGTSTATVTVTVRAMPELPGKPTVIRVRPGAQHRPYTAKVWWKAPTSDGGTKITGYLITAQKYDARRRVTKTLTFTARPTPLRKSLRLTSGSWKIRVQAVNLMGNGPMSRASKTVHPR